MTLDSVSATTRLSATVTPADPLSSGTYDIGAGSLRHSFPAANQIYSLKVSAQEGPASLDLQGGALSPIVGGQSAGGEGKDPDGQPIDLDTIYALRIQNTGSTELEIAAEDWEGSTPFFTDIVIPVGGDVVFIAPDGNLISEAVLSIGTTDKTFSWEAVILGKTQP